MIEISGMGSKVYNSARFLLRDQAGYGKFEVRNVRQVRRSVHLIYDTAMERSANYTPAEVVARCGRGVIPFA